jgi:hypothetical protein
MMLPCREREKDMPCVVILNTHQSHAPVECCIYWINFEACSSVLQEIECLVGPLGMAYFHFTSVEIIRWILSRNNNNRTARDIASSMYCTLMTHVVRSLKQNCLVKKM